MSEKLNLKITNETARLRAVVLGTANSNGATPRLEDAYDPKSMQHIKAGTYPSQQDMIVEIEAVNEVLERYDVTVFRPEEIQNCNQIFTRDIAFVIEDKIIISNMLTNRAEEIKAIQYVIDQIDADRVLKPSNKVQVEGGDVMLHNDYIFVGTYLGDDFDKYIIARTNPEAVTWLQDQFPNKKVVGFDLVKSNTDPYSNSLHLDCCFQPVGDKYAIAYPDGFRNPKEYQWLKELIGEDNVFEIDNQEMYDMNSNVFSISPTVVISEKNFERLNTWLRSKGITVEEVPYAEIAKQEGLLRCSTLPLIRD